jgi:membrane fusion protein (multidrug efflux system)
MSAFAGCGKGDKATGPGPAPEVRVVEVLKLDVPLYREWVGEVLCAEDIEVRARVEGWLEGIHFREGTMVRKG